MIKRIRQKLLHQLIWPALILLATSIAHANNSISYQVQTPMANRDSQTIKQTFQTAAIALTTKLTGSTQATTALTPMLKDAQNWVDSYQITPNEDNPEQPWLLTARFAPNLIDQALKQAHLHIWQQPRPSIMVWLQDADTLGTPLPINDTHWEELQDAANKRGLTIIQPTDYENLFTSNPDSSTDTNELAAMAKKHHVNNVLVATLPSQNNTQANTQWQWWHNNETQQWSTPTNPQWANETLEKISSTLAQNAIANANDINAIKLNISGIKSFSDYAQALHSLQKITLIKNMVDDGLQNDQILVALTTNAPIADLKTALDHIPSLHQETTPNTSQADLTYYWGNHPPPQLAQPTSTKQETTPTSYIPQATTYPTPPQPTMNEQATKYAQPMQQQSDVDVDFPDQDNNALKDDSVNGDY